ncbi:MAG: alpha/beta hydrolase, partial [Bacteroidetes bacterium]|nr:alpha/beta hydrolase [Fibrella sp.]
MPLIAPSSYRPPAYLRNAHLQTILPATIRRVTVPYVRERIDTPDNDFLNLDWVRKGGEVNSGLSFSSSVSLPPLIILSHGLEGDSRRPYLAGMV